MCSLLKNLSRRVNTERERLKRLVEERPSIQALLTSESDHSIANLTQALQDSLRLNEELKLKLEERELSSTTPNGSHLSEQTTPQLPNKPNVHRSQSLSSKASESFFDAAENLGDVVECESLASSMSMVSI